MRPADVTQHLTRVVDLRAVNHRAPGIVALGRAPRVRRGRLQIEIIPDALPECVEVRHGPLPHCFVVGEGEVARFAEPAAIQRHQGNVRGGRGEVH